MRVNVFKHYSAIIEDALKTMQNSELFAEINASVEKPNDASFGDLTSNVAMVLSSILKKNPMIIAEEIAKLLSDNSDFVGINVKKPGFLNWNISPKILFEHVKMILTGQYNKIDIGNGERVNIEYVSANPTGPLHAGHTRGAVVGDVLANLMEFAGFDVTREYYINDAGNQVNILANSLLYRYLQAAGVNCSDDDSSIAYPGQYLVDLGIDAFKKFGTTIVNMAYDEQIEFFKKFAIEEMMKMIKQDLLLLKINHDVFTSEREIVNSGKVDEAIECLRKKDLVYKGILDKPKGKEIDDWEARDQLLFRSSLFGDDVDRPLQKSDGSWTYFATDIAYHLDKLNRGFPKLIDFWGADHGGYIKRMQSAVEALSDKKDCLTAKICQLVKFVHEGEEMKMSKRSGTFVTARDIVESVGPDVVRFMMLTRRDDASLDFDFEQVREQSRANPVFYVQYAYARTHSVLKQYKQNFPNDELPNVENIDFQHILDEKYLKFINALINWPKQVQLAVDFLEPHRIAFYLLDTASAFHSLWNMGKDQSCLRFVDPDDLAKTKSRLSLVLALQIILELGLKIMGVVPLRELRA